MWTLLILCDHWQGEFCIALFGAIGWSALCIIFPDALDRTTYDVMKIIMPVHAWVGWFCFFGMLQLAGLSRQSYYPARLAGALGIFFGFMVIVYGILSSKPVPLGLSVYFAAAAIEGLAVVYHTGQVARSYKGLPKWIIRR